MTTEKLTHAQAIEGLRTAYRVFLTTGPGRYQLLLAAIESILSRVQEPSKESVVKVMKKRLRGVVMSDLANKAHEACPCNGADGPLSGWSESCCSVSLGHCGCCHIKGPAKCRWKGHAAIDALAQAAQKEAGQALPGQEPRVVPSRETQR